MRDRGGRREGGQPPPSRSSKSTRRGQSHRPSWVCRIKRWWRRRVSDRGEGKIRERAPTPPCARGSSPRCCPPPSWEISWEGNRHLLHSNPNPPTPSLPTENLFSPFLHPSHPTLLLLPYFGGSRGGVVLDTCGLEGLRGMDVGASSSSPTPRVGYGPADPLWVG